MGQQGLSRRDGDGVSRYTSSTDTGPFLTGRLVGVSVTGRGEGGPDGKIRDISCRLLNMGERSGGEHVP